MGLNGIAMAFHDGGVAHCDGCHTMHNSEDGVSIIDGGVVGTAGAHLTIGADPSSTCLNCHQGSGTYHIFSDDGSNYTPGGDFYWLTKTYTYTTFRPFTRNGHNFGHSIIAADYGLIQDADLATAPGGTFPSGKLYCSSCHDPHGKKVNKTGPIVASGSYLENYAAHPGEELGNFRLLGDIGYSPSSSGVTFVNGPPIATTPSPFGPGRQETDSSHTDYGSGMAEWCANCHTGFLNQSVATHRHVAGNSAGLTTDIADNYNSYVKSGDLGPASGNVACISCHRAHASAFPNSGRWDFETEFLVDSHPQASDGGSSQADEDNSYYGRDIVALYGDGQRSLCNKCHVQD
jgi:hypothetical protein